MTTLAGKRALVTSGPTVEPVDPVRYLSNRSSGKQGYAIAEALRDAHAQVVLISGPVALPDPPGITVTRVQSAVEMLEACKAALPVDIAVCAAAVSDWRVAAPAAEKLKKREGVPPVLTLIENPDILKALACETAARPRLVIGFAAETENLLSSAAAKRIAKGCDWIVANDVSGGKAFDAEENEVMLITPDTTEAWPRMAKRAIASLLVARIAEYFGKERSW